MRTREPLLGYLCRGCGAGKPHGPHKNFAAAWYRRRYEDGCVEEGRVTPRTGDYTKARMGWADKHSVLRLDLGRWKIKGDARPLSPAEGDSAERNTRCVNEDAAPRRAAAAARGACTAKLTKLPRLHPSKWCNGDMVGAVIIREAVEKHRGIRTQILLAEFYQQSRGRRTSVPVRIICWAGCSVRMPLCVRLDALRLAVRQA